MINYPIEYRVEVYDNTIGLRRVVDTVPIQWPMLPRRRFLRTTLVPDVTDRTPLEVARRAAYNIAIRNDTAIIVEVQSDTYDDDDSHVEVTVYAKGRWKRS
jgi:hypothetical protein